MSATETQELTAAQRSAAEMQARIDAMTPEQRAQLWDAHYHLDDRTWRLYTCCDCDPAHADPSDPDDEANQYDTPALIVVPTEQGKPDNCVRCGGYLSLDEGEAVRVTTLGATPRTTVDPVSDRAREDDAPLMGAVAALEVLGQLRADGEAGERVERAVRSVRAILAGVRGLASEYADIDGGHHKQWALVKVARLAGAELAVEDEGIPA